MKVCQKCGRKYADDNVFCEDCGEKLENLQNTPMYQNHEQAAQEFSGLSQNKEQSSQQKKKTNVLLIVIIAIIVIVAIAVSVVILFKDKLPIGKKDDGQQETVMETTKEEEAFSAEQKEEEDRQEKKDEQKDVGQEDNSVSYADVQLNGVDNVYVQVSGIVAQEEEDTVLQLPSDVSVCAYDLQQKVILGEHVSYLVLEGEDIEEYVGAQISVKGKLLADTSGTFDLKVVNLQVEKAAVTEEKKDLRTHRYELIQDDVTWQEAFEDCKARGGYLIQINSEEEYQSVISQISQAAMQNIHFYLGGRRDELGSDYYWVDTDDEFVGDMLNPAGESWSADHWMENEPSFISDDEEEMYMNLVFYQNEWVLNDVPMDITVFYPGKTGYICEFDE